MSRRRWWIALAVVAVCAGTAAIAAPWAIERSIVSKAAERGITLRVGEVEFARGGVWLHDVEAKWERLPGARAVLANVKLAIGWGGLRGVEVSGGSINVRATRGAIADALRREEPGEPSSGSTDVGRTLEVRGVFVRWLPKDGEEYSAWGVRVERSPDGRKVGADLVRARHPVMRVELQQVEARADLAALLIRRVSAAQTEVELNLAHLTDVMGDEGTEATSAASGTPSGSPSQAPQKNDREPPADQLASTSTEEQGPRWLRLSPGRGQRVRKRMQRWVGLIARRLPEDSELHLDGVRLRFRRDQSQVNLGPAELHIRRLPDVIRVSFVPGFEASGAQRLELEARLPTGQGEVEVRVAGGPVRLSTLGVQPGDLGLARIDDTKLRLDAELTMSEDAEVLRFNASGRLEQLAIEHSALSEAVVVVPELSWNWRGKAALDGSELDVEAGEIQLGSVSTKMVLAAQRDAEHLSLQGRWEVPLASCQSMFDSLPEAIVPLLQGVKMSGTFSWKTELDVDTRRLKDMRPRWNMQNDCRFEEIPDAISPDRFQHVFTYQVPDEFGTWGTKTSGPGSAQWVPIHLLPSALEAAILVTEDGRFWSHRGFDQRAIESSIRQNVAAGKFVRGASTISMQLAKNLYLSRSKVLSRKIQEALLTMLLEQELRKDEILELYFNVVEFGPGIFGVRRAAEYYFSSEPAELSVAQSFFLASVLPSPRRQYFDEQGELKPRWARYVHRLLRIAFERERLTQEQLDEGLEESLRFGVPHMPALEDSEFPFPIPKPLRQPRDSTIPL